jgi:RNA polymerase sigma-70 factor (ECF subfamily)
MRIPTDRELLLSSGRGDRDAFTLLVQRHHRAIVHFVHRFLAAADRATAEDLAQQVFLNAWKYAPTFQPRAKVLTWLFRIATNACLNHRRSEESRMRLVRRDHHRQSEGDGGGERADLHLERSERAQKVRVAVAALPANQRAVIVLRHFHGLSYGEIAEVTATSTSAVDSLLHRARRALCDKLGAKKDEDSSQRSSL